MADIAAHKQLGRLNAPVVFDVSEGPNPGPVAEAVQKDSPAPAGVGMKPGMVLAMGVAMIVGGYFILRPLVD